jgi:hypothetical protein
MATLRGSLVDSSGGLVYHWRALCYRRRLWWPFIHQVATWLQAWHPPQRELVLIGPSAGYTVSPRFLERFFQVTVLEPDPLARRLLFRRFPAVRFKIGAIDCMADMAGPDELVAAYPQAAFLFANVIGQRLAGLPPEWPDSLMRALAHRSWASYHDVIATAQVPNQSGVRSFTPSADLETVLAGFWSGGELPLYDHGSFGVLPADAYVLWRILPNRHHLVGWTSSVVVATSDVMPGNSGMGGRS